jgi:hypothetical protein
MKMFVFLIIGLPLLASCTSSNDSREKAGTGAQPATQTGAPASGQAATRAPVVPVDACALLTKADVEGMAGKKVLDGRKEEIAQLVTCAFGDPSAPQVGGRALSQILTLSVMTGDEGAYYKGATAQVKDTFEIGRKNAADAAAQSGLGDDAYWDSVLHKLSVVKGKYLVEANVEADGGLKLARAAVTKSLERLPQD